MQKGHGELSEGPQQNGKTSRMGRRKQNLVSGLAQEAFQ
jgi:hypothetical protein